MPKCEHRPERDGGKPEDCVETNELRSKTKKADGEPEVERLPTARQPDKGAETIQIDQNEKAAPLNRVRHMEAQNRSESPEDGGLQGNRNSRGGGKRLIHTLLSYRTGEFCPSANIAQGPASSGCSLRVPGPAARNRAGAESASTSVPRIDAMRD